MQRWCGLLLGHCWSSTRLGGWWCTSLCQLQMSSKWGKNLVEVLAKMVWSSSCKVGRWRCRPTQALILCPEEDRYTSWSKNSRFPACFKQVSEKLLISTQQQPAEKYSTPQHTSHDCFHHHVIPMVRQLETKNRGHIGGLRGWNFALEHKPQVRAPGDGGSFSPVAAFKLCS